MKNVKITVLRKQLYEDFAEEHLTDGIQPCDFYEEGDTFLYTGGAEMPEGFCPWAWSMSWTAAGPGCAFWSRPRLDKCARSFYNEIRLGPGGPAGAVYSKMG